MNRKIRGIEIKTSPTRRAFVIALTSGSVCVAIATLYSCYCAFSWLRFTLDYGIYANMMWNSAHGNPFVYFVDASYLKKHLSISLLLLSPLFAVVKHPFLLSVVQWFTLIAGAFVIWRTARRRQVDPLVIGAIIFCYLGYPFTQAVMLCEYHAASLYFLLVPCLWSCLCLKRGLAWIPLLVLLGVREDAFLLATPLLVFFAVRDRCPSLWILAGASLLYGVFAIFVMYPAINGVSLFKARAGWIPSGAADVSLGSGGMSLRMWATLWVLLPALPLLKRGWMPIVALVSVPLLVALASNSHYQYGLKVHYPAPVMACLAVAIVEACTPGGKHHNMGRSGRLFCAAYLVAITIGSHIHRGFLPFGGKNQIFYSRVHPKIEGVLRMIKKTPKAGVLLCPDDLLSASAHRSDVIPLTQYKKAPADFDLALVRTHDLLRVSNEPLRELIMSGKYGVLGFDGTNALLQINYNMSRNPELTRALLTAPASIGCGSTLKQAGRDVYVSQCRKVRHWDGNGMRAPAVLVYGRHVLLEPGAYVVKLSLRAKTPKKAYRGNWGSISLHRRDEAAVILVAPIDEVSSRKDEFRIQQFPLVIDVPTEIEPRVTAGDAELWLHTIQFEKMSPEGTSTPANRAAQEMGREYGLSPSAQAR